MKVRGADLALAAHRTKLLGQRLDDAGRDALIESWRDLLDEIEASRSAGAGELALVAYRVEIEERLAELEGRPYAFAQTTRRPGGRRLAVNEVDGGDGQGSTQ